MARCCGGGCSCKIVEGSNITVTGVGSAQDPFVIATDIDMDVVDNDVFNLSLGGDGSATSPWALQVAFASTAQLTDVPDVNAPTPTNGQVLGWDNATQRWTPRAPTTAPTGAVSHDTSLAGDGSVGTPLQVQEDPTRGLSTTAGGLGITDALRNSTIRKFADATARAATTPVPTLNTLSELDTRPGVIDYWTGSQWLPVKGQVAIDAVGQEMLALSGAYADGLPVTMMVREFSGITGADGTLTIIPNSLISTRAGVLSVAVTVTGAQPYHPTVNAGTDNIYITARRIDDGFVLAGQAVTGQVTAYVY